MTERTGSVTHIIVGWNDDYEQAYIHEAAPGEAEGTDRTFEADVPTDLWQRYAKTLDEINAAMRAVVEASGFDEESGRMAECCPSWRGYRIEGRRWWRVEMSASSDPDTWPIRTVPITYENSPEAAQTFIDRLPERMHVYAGGGPESLSLVERDRLRVVEGGTNGYDSGCDRCGWPRHDHADAGEVHDG